ncbi:predicted protein [Chaetomium globosum CBS 148.51]|uniref:Transcription factor domain-containing protein n=1 Tax=Chaetomium globosum (strain ATCC 6205 / CBS 148.51 / DSM 1962 / NBRC 6347 / NRRL 1970) TaxID=306901 RepID=Q2H5S1_CHAGB|nr:uncharacterized protein CHGG_05994 [Chaetomium globosum CBS 148.51]EAQ89375.1 predicted protein [Chaetomium globosum CBS 148.51]
MPSVQDWEDQFGVRGAISRRARGMLHTQRKQVPSAQIVKPVPLPTTPSLSDLVLTIIDNYVPEADTFPPESSVEPSPRICGSWVEILPDIIGSGRDEALASAIRAFAISILSRGPKRSFAISEGLEAYNHALISVNHALRSPYSDFPVAIAAAVMCLLLAEFFHATSLGSWAAHLQGLADLMQLSRPEFYGSGIPHRLFVGARPVLMVLAFSSKKSSFLAREDWKSIPFRETPPSPVQSLMSEAAAIPSILERIDAEGDGAAEETLPAFEAALDRLDAWADGFCSSAPESSPMFWIRPSEDAERSSIWFRNITVANALTHFWAFKVICLRNIDELRTSRAHPNSNQGTEMAYFEEVKRLSVMICQSIEYLMQDRMKLFGPQSVPMPLHTAHEAFEAGVDRSRDELSWCREILKDLKNRGYAFM